MKLQIFIEKVWSNNLLLPKANIIKAKLAGKYYPAFPSNKFDSKDGKRYTYRLKPKLIIK